MSGVAGCALCDGIGGRVVFEAPQFRVVRAVEAGFPAFYRVIWREHAREFSDLPRDDRQLCMDAVTVVEQCLREHLTPTKINLAALGNMVPHLHWHVIARFDWDSHFPGPVWAGALRDRAAAREAVVEGKLPAIEDDIARRLSGARSN